MVEMMAGLGESPTPCTADVHTTSIHYLELTCVMPRVIQSKRKLIAFYEQNAAALSTSARTLMQSLSSTSISLFTFTAHLLPSAHYTRGALISSLFYFTPGRSSQVLRVPGGKTSGPKCHLFPVNPHSSHL